MLALDLKLTDAGEFLAGHANHAQVTNFTATAQVE